jgi:hypothetical protein
MRHSKGLFRLGLALAVGAVLVGSQATSSVAATTPHDHGSVVTPEDVGIDGTDGITTGPDGAGTAHVHPTRFLLGS